MLRKQSGRRGLRAFAAITGIAGAVLVGGSATSQASTVPAQATGLVRQGTPGARPATFPFPTPCSQTSAGCTYNSGWNTYGDGSCEAETVATWSGMPANVLDVTIKMYSPNLFSSCTSYTTVYFGMTPPAEVTVGPYWGFACAALDPTCSDTQTWTYQTSNAVPASDLPDIEDLFMITSKNS